MTGSGWRPGLDDPRQSGVYLVPDGDLDALGVAARDAALRVRRVDLDGCDKATLLLRFAAALELPPGRARNWDALADSLRDLGWLPAPGHALLLEHGDTLRTRNQALFAMLLDILEEAAASWAGRDRPFWAFLAFPDAALDALEQATGTH